MTTFQPQPAGLPSGSFGARRGAPARAQIWRRLMAAPQRLAIAAGGLLLVASALWWALADVGAVTRPATHQACDDAIDAWAVRQLSTATPSLDAVRFATTEQMQTLIESLKKWLARVKRQGAAVLRDQAKNDMSCVGAFARARPGR